MVNLEIVCVVWFIFYGYKCDIKCKCYINMYMLFIIYSCSILNC